MTPEDTNALTEMLLALAKRLDLPIVRANEQPSIAGQLVILLSNLREDLKWTLRYADNLSRHAIIDADPLG